MASTPATLKASPFPVAPKLSPLHGASNHLQNSKICTRGLLECRSLKPIVQCSPNGSVALNNDHEVGASSAGDVHRRRSSLESLFCYDKPIPEEIIEEPVGLSIAEKVIGNNPRCYHCQAKGAVLCTTCQGSGLYVDSIMESQGIIVKVRCLELAIRRTGLDVCIIDSFQELKQRDNGNASSKERMRSEKASSLLLDMLGGKYFWD